MSKLLNSQLSSTEITWNDKTPKKRANTDGITLHATTWKLPKKQTNKQTNNKTNDQKHLRKN